MKLRTVRRRQATRYLWREALAGRRWHAGYVVSEAAGWRAEGETGRRGKRRAWRTYAENLRLNRAYAREVRERDESTWDDLDRYMVEHYV